MGSGVSAAANEIPGGDLRLPESNIKFTTAQLRALNSYVETLYHADQQQRMSIELENRVESLVQRIVDGAGQKDPRFRCCHLIALHRGKKMRSRSLEYLVTLDALPVLNADNEDCVLQEGPAGYAKVRVSGQTADTWEEFLTPNGYLCRDKVVERWVELIASCAHIRGGGGSRVVCARGSLNAIPYQYCYMEKATPHQSSMNTRLAIVEGAAWVMVRIGAGQAEAKLVLGIKAAGCTASAYTSRIPLTHPMAMLHYAAAQTGFYAVAIGPPSSLSCSDRQATWQLWHPALESTLDGQCAEFSAVGRLCGALNALVDRLRDGVVQGALRVVSRYAACSVLRRRLERCGAHALAAARCAVSLHMSHHLLLILDTLISVCERRHPAGYIYDLDRTSCARRGIRTVDADWATDANCLRNYILHLHAETAKAEEIPLSPSETLECVLFRRWENLVKESRAVSTSTSPVFCKRQLRYIWRLTRELVNMKKCFVCKNQSTFKTNLINATSIYQEPVEDLIHVFAIMLDQARDLYLANNFPRKPTKDLDKEHIIYRSKKWNKLKDYFDASSAFLIDAVRRDPGLHKEDLNEDTEFVKNILNWLYKGAKDDKKYLGPVLKPYLESLYLSSLETSWFLEEFDAKKCEKEFEGLKQFCLDVHHKDLDPCMGLLNAAKKLSWAKAMVNFIDRAKNISLRIVFPTEDGMAISFPITLPTHREHYTARSLTLSRRDKADAKLRLAKRCVLAAFNGALTGELLIVPSMSRHSSTDEILKSVKSGQFWRNTPKPDIIPGGIQELADEKPKSQRRSRRQRPLSAYPEVSISSQDMKRKYHTLKSLVYVEPVESWRDLRDRPRSAGSTLRMKETMSRPNLLETLDFINGMRDALCVEESGASDIEESAWSAEDDWLLGQTAPLNVLARSTETNNLHYALGDLVEAMLYRGKFTILQELCTWLGESREGALFALHRLARAARSRSSERSMNAWKLPEVESVIPDSPQRYKARPPDYFSGDEVPLPPPLPRKRTNLPAPAPRPRYPDYLPPKRIQDLEKNLQELEIVNSRLNNYPSSKNTLNQCYTGILNPIYNEKKLPKNKFSAKRSKSLGRSFSTRRVGLEVAKYNLSLGHRAGKKTNDIITAIKSTEEENDVLGKYSSVAGNTYRCTKDC